MRVPFQMWKWCINKERQETSSEISDVTVQSEEEKGEPEQELEHHSPLRELRISQLQHEVSEGRDRIELENELEEFRMKDN